MLPRWSVGTIQYRPASHWPHLLGSRLELKFAILGIKNPGTKASLNTGVGDVNQLQCALANDNKIACLHLRLVAQGSELDSHALTAAVGIIQKRAGGGIVEDVVRVIQGRARGIGGK